LVSAGSGNTIRRNSISSNAGPGISLASGANNNIVAPTLSTAKLSGSTLTVQGSFTATTANVNYVLEFFANPTGNAEGKIYLGSLTVTSTTTGTPSFTFTATTTVTGANPLITATLTDNVGDTSAFSNAVTVSVLPTRVNTPNASTSFSFQPLNRNVDGLTSTTPGNGLTALNPVGSVGAGLDQTGSVDAIGLYINAVAPTNAGSNDLSGAGINSYSGDTFNVRMTYNGTSFMVKTTDVRTGDSAMGDILSWTYSTTT
jgi:parallel beta-helix repeat protein